MKARDDIELARSYILGYLAPEERAEVERRLFLSNDPPFALLFEEEEAKLIDALEGESLDAEHAMRLEAYIESYSEVLPFLRHGLADQPGLSAATPPRRWWRHWAVPICAAVSVVALALIFSVDRPAIRMRPIEVVDLGLNSLDPIVVNLQPDALMVVFKSAIPKLATVSIRVHDKSHELFRESVVEGTVRVPASALLPGEYEVDLLRSNGAPIRSQRLRVSHVRAGGPSSRPPK